MKNFKNNFGITSDSVHLLEAFVKEAQLAGWEMQNLDGLEEKKKLYFNGNTKNVGLRIGHFWVCDKISGLQYDLPTQWDAAIKAMKAVIRTPKPKVVKPEHTAVTPDNVKPGLIVVITGNSNSSENNIGDIGITFGEHSPSFNTISVYAGNASSSVWTKLSEMRLATPEEVVKCNYKLTSFGRSSIVIDRNKSIIVIDGTYIVTKKELDGLINHFNKRFKFCGYCLELPNIGDLVIAFGCKSGTFKEALEIQKLMNE